MATIAAVVHIVVEQGARWTDTIQLADPNGVPIDITDYSVNFVIKQRANDGGIGAVTLTVGDGIELTDPENGMMTVVIFETVTDTLDFDDDKGVYYCDIIAPGSGIVTRVLNGRVELHRK